MERRLYLVTSFLNDVASQRGKRISFHVPSGLVADERQILLLGKPQHSEYFAQCGAFKESSVTDGDGVYSFAWNLMWLKFSISVFKHQSKCVLHNAETCESAAPGGATLPCR